jgi:hypothetical protein
MNVPEEDLNQAAPASGAADPDAPDTLVLTLPDESIAPKDIGLWAGVLVLLTLVVGQ